VAPLNPALETRHLSKSYRRDIALADVTLSIPAGAIYALVGANGAGKSTLIKLLMNVIPAGAGSATVLGTPANRLAGADFERMGYVSENQELPGSMSVRAFLAYLRPFYSTWDTAREAQLVRQFDLPLNRKLKHLSRGMRMKAALAGVLAFRPRLIVLDEPLSGLDPFFRDEFIEALRHSADGATIFLSTHDLAEIELFATHVGFLERGHLLFSEEMSTLSARFREIAVTLPMDAAPPESVGLPATWLDLRTSGNTLRFVDSGFDPVATPRALAEQFPNAEAIAIAPMAFRAIFIAIARAGRSSRPQELEAIR
jgi:ABC-2 type transport system ATP-binding protein